MNKNVNVNFSQANKAHKNIKKNCDQCARSCATLRIRPTRTIGMSGIWISPEFINGIGGIGQYFIHVRFVISMLFCRYVAVRPVVRLKIKILVLSKIERCWQHIKNARD